jgi:Uma2 family endonuclease
MGALSTPKLSVEEYLALDREAELKSEYHDGVLFPICGVSVEHGRLCVRLGRRLEERLEGRPCFTLVAPLRVRVSRTKFVYPDIVVVCGEPSLTDEQADTLSNPKTILEVLSPSTRDYDYGSKFMFYRELPSFEEYVLVAQDRQRVEVYRRLANQEWRLSRYDGPEAILPLESLGISIPLTEIYSGIVEPGAAPEL